MKFYLKRFLVRLLEAFFNGCVFKSHDIQSLLKSYHKHTHRQTDRQTDRETDRHTDWLSEITIAEIGVGGRQA